MIVFNQKKVLISCIIIDTIILGFIIWLYLNGFFGQPILPMGMLIFIAVAAIVYSIAFQNPSTNSFNYKKLFEQYGIIYFKLKLKIVVSIILILSIILIGIYIFKIDYFPTYLLLFLTYFIIEVIYLIAVNFFKSNVQIP